MIPTKESMTMRSLGRRFASLALLAVAALLACPPSAHAKLTLTLSEAGFADAEFTDAGTPGYLVTPTTTFGTFSFESDIARSNALNGSAPARLTINSVSARETEGSGTGVLTITIKDDGFTAPGPGSAFLDTQLSTTSFSPDGSGATMQSFVNSTAGTLLSVSTTPAGTNSRDLVNVDTNPFSLTNVTVVTLGEGGSFQTTGTTTLAAVPEPATLAMAFAAVPILGLGYWRNRRRKLA